MMRRQIFLLLIFSFLLFVAPVSSDLLADDETFSTEVADSSGTDLSDFCGKNQCPDKIRDLLANDTGALNEILEDNEVLEKLAKDSAFVDKLFNVIDDKTISELFNTNWQKFSEAALNNPDFWEYVSDDDLRDAVSRKFAAVDSISNNENLREQFLDDKDFLEAASNSVQNGKEEEKAKACPTTKPSSISLKDYLRANKEDKIWVQLFILSPAIIAGLITIISSACMLGICCPFGLGDPKKKKEKKEKSSEKKAKKKKDDKTEEE